MSRRAAVVQIRDAARSRGRAAAPPTILSVSGSNFPANPPRALCGATPIGRKE
jgi:hypothetical protein